MDTADVDHVVSFIAAMRKLQSRLPREPENGGLNEAESHAKGAPERTGETA